MRWKLFLASAILGSLLFEVIPTNAEKYDAMDVPFMTQFDNSAFASTDCGPASVAMAIDYATGEHLTPLQARQAIARMPGGGYASNPGSGTAIQDLARVARAHDVEAFMGDGKASTGWTPQRIRDQLSQGHPVIVLTHLSLLPGYGPSDVDHYILVIGTTSSGFVYNDPAMSRGGKRIVSEKQLWAAERASSVPSQGAAFAGPHKDEPPAPAVPDALVKHITVLRGDTLSELAQKHGVELNELIALNRASLPNINHIEVGQELALPVTEPAAEEAPKADQPAPAEQPKSEPAAADAAKADAPKADAPKAEAPKADTAKADAPKADAAKADAPKAEQPKAEQPKPAQPTSSSKPRDPKRLGPG